MKAVEYLVFDEGDRLFEMGFQDDIKEIVGKVRVNFSDSLSLIFFLIFLIFSP